MLRVYLALGSNLASPLQQITDAIYALKQLPHTNYITSSSFYRTKPLGPQDQPDYLNAVIALDTELAAETLLDHTQSIEREQGRIRDKNQRWGPRTLDIDMLLYGDQQIQTTRLTVPHYDMFNREFMLYPLHEIVPDLILPDGTLLAERTASLPKNGLCFWHT